MNTIRGQRPVTWFAAGAVATLIVTVVAMQAWRVGAAPTDEDTNLVPITPCRLADTRPGDDRVGDAGTLSTEDTTVFQAVGDNGECTGIPPEAVGLSLNVTALRASERTFLTIWPDGEQPNASSLNPDVGQPPVPNAVTTKLGADGAFRVYNDAGNVDVIIDINGYLIPAEGVGAFEVVSASFPIDLTNRGDTSGNSVECPEGKNVTGGGASIVDNNGLDIRASIPFGLDGWSARVTAEDSPYTGTLNIYAICASGIVAAP